MAQICISDQLAGAGGLWRTTHFQKLPLVTPVTGLKPTLQVREKQRKAIFYISSERGLESPHAPENSPEKVLVIIAGQVVNRLQVPALPGPSACPPLASRDGAYY